jgi:hypothetical protein
LALALLLPLAPELLHELLQDLQELGRIILPTALAALATALRHCSAICMTLFSMPPVGSIPQPIVHLLV